MLSRAVLRQILDDERVVRGLGDAEASFLIEWMVDRAEELALDHAEAEVDRILQNGLRRLRAIVRFVDLWCHQQNYGAACQLGAVERFQWPMPCSDEHPCDLLARILIWEREEICRAVPA